ncbi:MAG: hypothetical protein Q9193_005694, partial [Seirophora villosa]
MDSMSMTPATAGMGMSPTMTDMAGMATSSAASMSGMGMGNGCKISMLWNWYTVDSCFISSTWRITSTGKFAGSCIGVICLVIVLECLRRLQREYDAYLVKQYRKRNAQTHQPIRQSSSESPRHPDIEANSGSKNDGNAIFISSASDTSDNQVPFKPQRLVPTVFQQAIRALIHMLQFAVAYFIMLLAMYYNGYIIISIIIGAFLGAFIFSWEGIHITDA